MNKRVYYRLVLKTKSALSIGTSDSVETDRDVVVDGNGNPFIPATSLCGVYRSCFNEKEATRIFGTIENDISEESAVRVYDATLLNKAYISIRDSVALENKVAKPGAKFDCQIVERGAEFVTYIEITDSNRCSESDLETVIAAIHSGELRFGSKTTRGMGRLEVKECKKATFNIAPSDPNDWLNFDMFSDESWNSIDSLNITNLDSSSNDIVISLKLDVKGALSIREYSTEPNFRDSNDTAPDFIQLYIRDGKEKSERIPVIPGTSWAGAFRDRYEKLGGDVKKLFGCVAKNKATKSRISFSESEITGGTWKKFTRNSIDRFTGGTKDGALFTEETHYNGKTTLEIRVKTDAKAEAICANDVAPLIATIADLANGFLSVGGLTAVGHGLFNITEATMSYSNNPIAEFNAKTICEPNIKGIIQELDALVEKGASNG